VRANDTAILYSHAIRYMPSIMVRDPTLVERLRKFQPVPDDYFDGAIYELLRRAERAEFRPKLSGLDNLPQLILEEIKKALDGRLAEMLKSALLPAVSNLSLEIPVELSIRVKLRFEPVFDVTPSEAHAHVENHNTPLNNNEKTNGAGDRVAELDELERRAIELLKARGGCWEGSAYSLARHVAGRVDWALETRLRRRLIKRDGKICLPEAAKETASDVVVVE